MGETPEQRVARLEAELAQAKVEALQKELDAARVQAGDATPATWTPSAEPVFGGARFGRTPTPDTHLAPVPRAVPASYRLIITPFNWVILFLLFMTAVAPIAVWIFAPLAGVIVAGVAFVLVMWLFLRRWMIRNALLKWGQVATVVNPDVVSVGTYYSGTTVQNVRIAQAHGWTVERQWYSGPVTKTRVEYVLNGVPGTVTIRGLPYDNGVILADSRRPTRAMCIHTFPYDIERDPSGNWTGKVRPRVIVTAILMLDLILAWTAAMVIICGNAANLF